MANKTEIIAKLTEIGERDQRENDSEIDTSRFTAPHPCARFEYVHGKCHAAVDIITVDNAQALGASLYRKVKITIEPME